MVENQAKNVEVEMNFHAPVASAMAKNEGLVIVNASPEKQTLASAASEIQKLLKQLEQTDPQASEIEQIAYVNATTSLSLKERVIGAIKQGGESAIDQFVLESKYLKVVKSIIKGWIKPV